MIQYKNFLIKREQSQARLNFAECEKSRPIAKLILTLVALFAMTAGAWADDYTITMNSEYTSVPTIYAGTANYFTIKVTNNTGANVSNIVAELYLGGDLIGTKNVASLPASETTTLDFYDPTIRPINENTIHGNSNENAVYKVVVEQGEVVKAQEQFSFVILYNGHLGKNYAYPNSNPTKREFSFTGDVKVLTPKTDTYLAASDESRNDVFPVELGDGESVYKALLYVSYNWDKVAAGDFKSWTTTFNGESISYTASYRDQGNLGNYGGYGYGLVVYDVTGKVNNGDNTFSLTKANGNVSVYPSSLIVMTSKLSGKPKTVYILEEADLLSNANNKHVDAIYESSFEDVANGSAANLYVFAAGAQAGEGDLKINGVDNTDVWSGTSSSFDTFRTPVDPDDVTVQFKATGSSILALHQMLIVEGGEPAPEDIDLTSTDGKTWTLAKMPAYDVELLVEYEPEFTATFAAANANTIEAGKATVKVKEGDAEAVAATLTDGKLTPLYEGQKVVLNAKEGYKFKAVSAKKILGITVSKGSTELSGDKVLYYLPGETYRQALAHAENKLEGDLGWGSYEGYDLGTLFYKEVSNIAWDVTIDGDKNFASGQGSCDITLDSVIDPTNHTFVFVSAN